MLVEEEEEDSLLDRTLSNSRGCNIVCSLESIACDAAAGASFECCLLFPFPAVSVIPMMVLAVMVMVVMDSVFVIPQGENWGLKFYVNKYGFVRFPYATNAEVLFDADVKWSITL